MKKLIVLSMAMLGLAVVSEAAPGVRGAKAVVPALQSTTAVIASKSPATVYSVIIGTGAVTDFVVLFDSANATAQTSVPQTAASGYRGRFYASSATAVTQVSFDPPLYFKNGVTAVNSTLLMSSFITLESGKAVQGY